MSANATTLSGLTTPNDEDLYVQAAELLLSGEGPNACTCGHDLPGSNHFADDLMPWTKCPACGLFYVLEDGEIAVYAPSDLVVTP